MNDGTAIRESVRWLWSLTVQPLAAMIAAELSRVLERPVRLDYARQSGLADVAARARAMSALVDKAGMPRDDAMWLVGWTGEPD